MNKYVLYSIIILAFAMIAIGIRFAFIDLQSININTKNDGYVGAIFSLSGILFFFAALMFQIKEYKLQVDELQKSVLAQTKSSEALDEQKSILLEQNSNNLLFGMISSFHDFKKRNETQIIITRLAEAYMNRFAVIWQQNIKELRLNAKELNEKFAVDIKEVLENSIIQETNFPLFKKYVQFAYNIFHLIDEKNKNKTMDIFTPFFMNQFNTYEIVMLYLSNLENPNMPRYGNLYWGYYNTKEIFDLLKKMWAHEIDFKDLDYYVLTEAFNKLKQNDTNIT
jgi:hypothetical protein